MSTLSTEKPAIASDMALKKAGWGLALAATFFFLTGCTDIMGPKQDQNSVQVPEKSVSAQSNSTAKPDSLVGSKIKITKVGEVSVNAEFVTAIK